MTTLALGLVLGSAGCHALWNLLLKRAGGDLGGGIEFVFLFFFAGAVLWFPAAVIQTAIERPHIGGLQLLFIGGSGLLHLGYFFLLQRGYRVGDLSVVYPLARGTGPVLAIAGAIVILGERPSGLALAGAGLVAAGVISLSGGPSSTKAIGYALATGLFIAVYTLWDKHGVDALAVPPILYDWSGDAIRATVLLPVVLRRRAAVAAVWRRHRREVLGVAILGPGAYILVLSALTFTPASYVAPAREISIAIAAAMGVFVLKEGQARRRLAAALVIVGGLVALALG